MSVEGEDGTLDEGPYVELVASTEGDLSVEIVPSRSEEPLMNNETFMEEASASEPDVQDDGHPSSNNIIPNAPEPSMSLDSNIWNSNGKDVDRSPQVTDVIPNNPAPSEALQAESNIPQFDNPEDKDPDKGGEKKQSVVAAATSKALRPFVIISSSYLLFTITDGAIRMIVLLHAYNKLFSAFEVAIMFTLYELAGVFTNLAAGFMGAMWGIKFTLICGLTLQIFSYGLLFGWKDEWTKEQAIIYVTISQMFAGIAKDLTKLGGKTVTKLVTPDEQSTKLFKLVSLITGWKNSLKGVGYFLGSWLIQINYELALGVMMALVVLAMPWAILGLDRSLGTAKKTNATWREVFNPPISRHSGEMSSPDGN
jgi:hypothetical protein